MHGPGADVVGSGALGAAIAGPATARLSSPPLVLDRGDDLPRVFPVAWFLSIHLACFAAIWTGVSWVAVGLCVGFYAVRMFAVSAGYHRYFAHRSYRTSRPFRFVLALLGTLALQKGPLWWASTHRRHHRESDGPGDVHSPRQRGFWWAHVGWVLAGAHTATDWKSIPDLASARELRWLDRWAALPAVGVAALFYGAGAWLERRAPGLGTSGPQLLVWGMAISTVLLYHGTWCVNSVVHVRGSRRFETSDDSRNNLWVALWTFGEGWHNNHHRYPASERQGFYRGEIDLSHAVLRVLERLRLVRDLKAPPPSVLREGACRRTPPRRRRTVHRGLPAPVPPPRG
jgi:stearoyl-CoA desaturase (delta-9 desaturase)